MAFVSGDFACGTSASRSTLEQNRSRTGLSDRTSRRKRSIFTGERSGSPGVLAAASRAWRG